MMRILGRPFLIGAVVILSLILLVLLAVASANTEFFDEYFAWLYAANLVIGILFLLVIVVPEVTLRTPLDFENGIVYEVLPYQPTELFYGGLRVCLESQR
mgnify:CR=1 FL=1